MDPVGSRNYVIGILLIVIAILVLSSFFDFKGPFSTFTQEEQRETRLDEQQGTSTREISTTTPEEERVPKEQVTPPQTTQTTRPQTPPSANTSTLDETLVVVTYTDSGFIPPVIEVEAGHTVTFINSSSKPLWVTSEYHPTAKGQYYPEFDQGRSVAIGGTYTFQFTKVGVWGYKNLNNESHLGAVSVIAQQ